MGMPQAIEWTAARVRALPDDGKRYELIDGELVVTPSPRPVHQLTVGALVERLRPYVRTHRIGHLLCSPADLSLGEDEILQPDLFVAPASADRPFREWTDIRELLLVIEILSPTTARYDRTLKRRRFQRAQVPEYWIVDPDARLIERWRPDDVRPEIVTDILEWHPAPAAAPLRIALEEMFGEVWEG